MKRAFWVTVVSVIGVLVFSLFLRSHNYSTWPRMGATFDEFAWPWLGISIIKDGVPRSWSYHPQYKDRQLVVWKGANFILVRPYLEHPPLFGMVAGGYAWLTGQKDFTQVRLVKMRALSLFFGASSVALVFWLATLLYGKLTGLLAALVYAVTPTVAVGSRLLQNENFFIPVWLLVLILLWYYLKKKKTVYRNAAAVLSGLLILAKIPWVTAGLSVFAILWYAKRYKDAWISLLMALGIGSLYILYGMYYDKTVFMGLMSLQLNRYDITFIGLYSLWLHPLLADRYYLDGWIYWGWASLLITIATIKKHWFLLIAVFSYGMIYVLGIPDEPGHGWYRYPFYPFLSIATALVLKEIAIKNPFYRFVFLLAVGLPLLNATWGAQFGFSYLIYRFYILFASLSFLPYIWRSTQGNRIANISFIIQSIFIIFLTSWAIMGYNEQ